MITCSFPAFGQPLIVLLLLFPLIFVLLLLRLISHHHHFLCSGFLSFVDSICAWQRVFSKGSQKTRHLAFAWLQLCSLSIVGHLLLLLLGGGGGLLREQVQLGQELFLLLGPSILVQEGHGLHLPFHPGTVGADEHVVLGVALGQPLLGK